MTSFDARALSQDPTGLDTLRAVLGHADVQPTLAARFGIVSRPSARPARRPTGEASPSANAGTTRRCYAVA